MGTSERRMEIIKVLCLRRYETMGNLAFEFGVSKRTIQRDINEITSIIPIYIRTGRYGGGIYVMEHFKFDNVYMNQSEIILLEKIKDYFKNTKTDFFREKDIIILEHIIKKYSLSNIKADTCCPF